jgi:formate dehydrogenase major subunit
VTQSRSHPAGVTEIEGRSPSVRGVDADQEGASSHLGRVARVVSRWPLLRQVANRDVLALGATAFSGQTRALRARTADATAVASVCPYCATGCAQMVYVQDGRIVSIEGDDASPVSRGRSCPKGQATFELVTSSHRLDRVHYRAPYAASWSYLTLDEALDLVVDRILASRDTTWQEADSQGRPLNRTTGISLVGGATLDNEESYLLRKLVVCVVS